VRKPGRSPARPSRISTPAPAAAISVSRAFDDERLFGAWFSGSSWSTWKAVVKAAYAEPMTCEEVKLFRSVAERDPPKKRVREIWAAVGRRAGKDSIASGLSAYSAAFQSYEGLLRPGESATVLNLAVDKIQAQIALRYTRAYFDEIPSLKRLVTRETALDGLTLSNGVEITILPNNFRAVRGRSIALAILDEVAFWLSDESTSPDSEIYTALKPSMATIPGSLLIGISSPHRKSGLLYSKYRESYGKNDDSVLVVKGPSKAFNPTIPDEEIAEAMERDPAKARSEWGGEFRDDLSSFVAPELIENAVDRGVTLRPPIPGVVYIAGADPSGGVSDSFCCAIAHAEGVNGEIAVLDNLLEIKAPFSPFEATAQVCALLKSYGVTRVVGDRYSAGFARDAFSAHGVKYVHSDKDRSAIYGDVLPAFTSGRVRLLDNRRLVNQFSALERRTVAGGRDKIDHPDRSGHKDDAANAAALALIHATGAGRPRAVLHFTGVPTRKFGADDAGDYNFGWNRP
jgi:hypothetical protein